MPTLKSPFWVMVFLLAIGVPFVDAQRQPILANTSQARQAAKQKLACRGKGDQPFYWTPFILVGK
jgi:hypothetical protein